jgi:LacI family transcriptional regulator
MAPGGGADTKGMDWNHYACATIAYSWNTPETHRVATDHRHHVDVAFRTLIERGCKRIGFCLPPEAVKGVNGAWTDRFLFWQYTLDPKSTVPLFVGRPDSARRLQALVYQNKARWIDHAARTRE